MHARARSGVERSGGSVANTIAGLASLGARVGFIGRVADDRLGECSPPTSARSAWYSVRGRPRPAGRRRHRAQPHPDDPRRRPHDVHDARRRRQHSGPRRSDDELIACAQLTYLEGYLWDVPQAKAAFRRAIAVAHEAGRRVAMSMSDPFCVARHREDFLALIAGDLDVLFSNEEEICSLVGSDDVQDACRRVRRSSRSGSSGLTLTVTLGAAGARRLGVRRRRARAGSGHRRGPRR